MAFNSELQIPKLPGFSVPSSAVRPVTAPQGIPHHVPSVSLSQGCEIAPDCVLALTMASLKSNCSPCEETTRSRRALASRMASASSRRERKKSRQNQWAPSPAHRACTHFRCLPLNGGMLTTAIARSSSQQLLSCRAPCLAVVPGHPDPSTWGMRATAD
jgi:hypothetical protein